MKHDIVAVMVNVNEKYSLDCELISHQQFNGIRQMKAADFLTAIRIPSMRLFVATVPYAIGVRVAGFMLFEKHKNSYEILQIAIADQYKRQGIATSLVDVPKMFLRSVKRGDETPERIWIDATQEIELGGVQFFSRQGFKRVGSRLEFGKTTRPKLRPVFVNRILKYI